MDPFDDAEDEDPFGADPFADTEAVAESGEASGDPYGMDDVFSGMDGQEGEAAETGAVAGDGWEDLGGDAGEETGAADDTWADAGGEAEDAWGDAGEETAEDDTWGGGDDTEAWGTSEDEEGGGEEDPFGGVWEEEGEASGWEEEGEAGDEGGFASAQTETFDREEVFGSAQTDAVRPAAQPEDDDVFGAADDETDPFADTDAYAEEEIDAFAESDEVESDEDDPFAEADDDGGDPWDDTAATDDPLADTSAFGEDELDTGHTVDAGDAAEFWSDSADESDTGAFDEDDVGAYDEESGEDELDGGFGEVEEASADDTGLFDADFDFMAGATARRMREKISQREEEEKRRRPSQGPKYVVAAGVVMIVAAGGIFGWNYFNKSEKPVEGGTTQVAVVPTDTGKVDPAEVKGPKKEPLPPMKAVNTLEGKLQRGLNFGVALYEENPK